MVSWSYFLLKRLLITKVIPTFSFGKKFQFYGKTFAQQNLWKNSYFCQRRKSIYKWICKKDGIFLNTFCQCFVYFWKTSQANRQVYFKNDPFFIFYKIDPKIHLHIALSIPDFQIFETKMQRILNSLLKGLLGRSCSRNILYIFRETSVKEFLLVKNADYSNFSRRSSLVENL